MQITIKTYQRTSSSFQHSASICEKWLMQTHAIRFYRLGEKSVLSSWMKVQLPRAVALVLKKINLQFVLPLEIFPIFDAIESLDEFQQYKFECKRVAVDPRCVSICTALHSITSAIAANRCICYGSLNVTAQQFGCDDLLFSFFHCSAMFAVMSICAWHYIYKWFNKRHIWVKWKNAISQMKITCIYKFHKWTPLYVERVVILAALRFESQSLFFIH